MGKHKEALDILIHELCDFVGAETYCVTNGQSTGVIPTAASDDDQHQTMARSSSLAIQDKPLPALIFEQDQYYLSTEHLNERKTLFTMLFKSYISIKDR
jgi:hypothetical protein